MKELPKEVSPREFLQSLWSDVLWNAKRNPTPENFDGVDTFVKRHQKLFDEKTLEAFSYEELFKQHFPRRYAQLKSSGAHWREEFLRACKKAYTYSEEKKSREYDSDELVSLLSGSTGKASSQQRKEQREKEKHKHELWLAIRNRDFETIQSMIKAGKISRKDLELEDAVEDMSLRKFALQSGFQRALDEIFKHVIAPPLEKHEETPLRVAHKKLDKTTEENDYSFMFQQPPPELCDEDLLREALRTHQSLEVIQQCCEKVNVKEKMLSTNNLSWLEFACDYGHLDAAQLFVKTYQLPVTQRVLEAVCVVGNLAVLRAFLPRASGEEIDINKLCNWACQKGHLPLVKFFIEEMNIVTRVDADNFQEFVCAASDEGHVSIVKYLLERFPATKEDYRYDMAFKNGHAEVVEYVLNYIEENFPPKTEGEKMEWSFWLVEQLGRAAEGYREKGGNFNLATFKCLLDKGADLMVFLRDEMGVQLLAKLAATFYVKGPIPPFLKLVLTTEIENSKESDPAVSKIYATLLNALENPTAENYAALESEECKAYFSSEPIAEAFGQLFNPFLNARNPVVKEKVTEREEQHLSQAEIYFNTFSRWKNLEPVTVQNIDTVTLENTIMWEWLELLRSAVRHPTAANWNAVHMFKAKVEKDYGENEKLLIACETLYRACKAYETSPLMVPGKTGMGRDALSHVFFKLSDADRKAVREVSKSHKEAIDNLDERLFAYMYPLAYEKTRGHDVDWGKALKRVEKLLNTRPGEMFEALFRAVRDPSRDIEAVKKVLKNVGFGMGGDDFLERRDVLEQTTIYQCARRNGFTEALAAIYARICAAWPGLSEEVAFLAAIICYQPMEVVEKCYAKLDRANPEEFALVCRTAFVKAIAVDNREVVRYFLQKNIIDLNAEYQGEDLLSMACMHESFEIALILIKYKAHPFLLGTDDRTRLFNFVCSQPKEKQDEFAELLIKAIKTHVSVNATPTSQSEQVTKDAVTLVIKALRDPSDENLERLAGGDMQDEFQRETLEPMHDFCSAFILARIAYQQRNASVVDEGNVSKPLSPRQ